MLVAHLSRRRCSCRCVTTSGRMRPAPLGLVLLVSRSVGRRETVEAPLRPVNSVTGFLENFPAAPVAAAPRGGGRP